MSLRLSHTMNDAGPLRPAATECTGMTHARSQPGHMALVAGRAFAKSFWDFIALTAAAGQGLISSSLIRTFALLFAPRRANSSITASCGVMPLQVPPLWWIQSLAAA